MCLGLRPVCGQLGGENGRHLLLLPLLSIRSSLSWSETQVIRKQPLHVKSTFLFFPPREKSTHPWHSQLYGGRDRKDLSSIDSLNHTFLSGHLSDWVQFSLVKVMAEAETILTSSLPSHNTPACSWWPAEKGETCSRWFPSAFQVQLANPAFSPLHVGVCFMCWRLPCEHSAHAQLAVGG